MQLKIHTDASACKAMLSRRGLGRTKHVHRCYLWVQQRSKHVNPKTGDFTVHKCKTEENPADLGTKFMAEKKLASLLEICRLEMRSDVHDMALKI